MDLTQLKCQPVNEQSAPGSGGLWTSHAMAGNLHHDYSLRVSTV